MNFKLQIAPGLYPENQHSKKLWSEGGIYPEMKCFDYKMIEMYYRELTGQIKVDDSLTDWTLSVRIYLGGAMHTKEISSGTRGITYVKTNEKEIYIRISLPTSEEISWGIIKKHRFNQYAKSKTDKGTTIIPVDYDRFENMTAYIEESLKTVLTRLFTDGITLKGHKIKL